MFVKGKWEHNENDVMVGKIAIFVLLMVIFLSCSGDHQLGVPKGRERDSPRKIKKMESRYNTKSTF